MNSVQKGKFGENLARKYLERNGYILVAQNWTCHWGEIDLIFSKDNKIIFIEVKYRSNCMYGNASELLGQRKLKSLYRNINFYLKMQNLEEDFWQLDLIYIYVKSQKHILNHYKAISL